MVLNGFGISTFFYEWNQFRNHTELRLDQADVQLQKLLCISVLFLQAVTFKAHVSLSVDKNRQRNEDRVAVYQMFCNLHSTEVY